MTRRFHNIAPSPYPSPVGRGIYTLVPPLQGGVCQRVIASDSEATQPFNLVSFNHPLTLPLSRWERGLYISPPLQGGVCKRVIASDSEAIQPFNLVSFNHPLTLPLSRWERELYISPTFARRSL